MQAGIHPWTLLHGNQRPQSTLATWCQANQKFCECCCWLVVLCPKGRYYQTTVHFRIVKRDLCSNLCLTPVRAMADDPPDPVERWILSACATWPRPEDAPDIQATLLYAGLTLTGVMQLRDFEGLNSTEAMVIWPHLRETPMGFVDHLFSCFPRALLAQARKCGGDSPECDTTGTTSCRGKVGCQRTTDSCEVSLSSRMSATERHQEPSLHQD